MRRSAKALIAAALLCAALAPASAKASFGFERLEVTSIDANGLPAVMGAGSHPFAVKTSFDVNVDPFGAPEGAPKDLEVDLPAGFVGNPTAVEPCSNADFLTLRDVGSVEQVPSCPDTTAIGVLGVRSPGESVAKDFAVVYNLRPAPGTAAKFGFRALQSFVTVSLGIRGSGGNNVFASLANIQQIEPFVGSELTIWGNPADPAHDGERGTCLYTTSTCPAELTVEPFITLPRSCPGSFTTLFKMRSWQEQGTWVPGEARTEPGTVGCGSLGFAADVDAKPTTDQAESPSGLDFNIDINDEGLTNPAGSAQSDIKKAVVTMPAGMTLNPSAAEGLGTCSIANFQAETASSEPGEGCPQASKVGNVEVETPLLEGKLLKGQIFVATQDENLVHSMIAIYMVIKDSELGILVKLPGKVEPDPKTGQLVTTFGDAPYEIPQVPFSHFRFHFREGGRSPLITPPRCGKYTTTAVFTPWANPGSPVPVPADFEIGRGVAGGACPAGGVPPFKPGFTAGSLNNSAGRYSPFFLRLTRQDGEQDMTRFDSVFPRGVIGRIAGVSKCSDAAIAAAKSKTGRQELASPSCPANSQVGRVLGGAGVGSQLTYVPGKIFLAGPFGGDPLSVVVITPAVAGPFDAGTVVVREALAVDPETAEVLVDGAQSDPIPHILKGIPLKLRDLRAYVDRPNFTLNPTSCAPKATKATLFGGFLDVFSSADDVPVPLSSPYQAADCASLKFKPKVSLKLKGGTKRGDHPALTAVVDYPKGGDYANVGKAVVTFPHSAFLEQSHIRTVCTRVQFAAHRCPAGSIYGHVKATTPLLDEVVEGPVYLRSSSHPLPDLVFALRGIVEVDVVTRIDSVEGRIRGSLDSVPDVPVSKFILNMQGGKKGLIVNSRNLCAHKARAIVALTAQSGKAYDTNPTVVPSGCGGKSKGKKQRVLHRQHR